MGMLQRQGKEHGKGMRVKGSKMMMYHDIENKICMGLMKEPLSGGKVEQKRSSPFS